LVWPDTTVEDVGLARNISLLRKALDDEAGQ
jgi:DNA-binding winged helix-turn-helix (wHTH) protein